MTLSELIKSIRADQHLSLGRLSELTGISKGTLSLWERGKNPNNPAKPLAPTVENLRKLTTVLPYGLDELINQLDGDSEIQVPPPRKKLPSNILPLPQTKKVPMLGAVACGEPIYMDEVRGEYYPMDSSIRADFCLKAQGDSMSGARIYDGDIVFIQSSPEVENGQIAAVAVDDEATLKYFYQYGDTVVLRPANPKYEEMTFERDDMNRLRIFGRAVAFQSAL